MILSKGNMMILGMACFIVGCLCLVIFFDDHFWQRIIGWALLTASWMLILYADPGNRKKMERKKDVKDNYVEERKEKTIKEMKILKVIREILNAIWLFCSYLFVPQWCRRWTISNRNKILLSLICYVIGGIILLIAKLFGKD